MHSHMKAFGVNLLLALMFWAIVLPFNNAAWAQPAGWHYPPCTATEVIDQHCMAWLTDPATGNRVCAPGQMRDICVPIVNNNGNPNNLSNIQRCLKQGSPCVDATPVKTINGHQVTVAEVGGCWQYRQDYTCTTNTMVDTCSDLRADPKCQVQTRRCIDQDSLFGCVEYELSYQCMTKAGSSHQVELCGDTNVCVGGICWDTSFTPDEDFAKVVTDMEVARQIGVYSPDGLDIFKGVSNTCRSKRGAGLKNCCSTNTQGAGKTNHATMGNLVAGAAGYAAQAGSKFVLDTLYGDTVNWIGSGMSATVQAMPGGTGFLEGISSPSFSYMGFSIGGTGTFLGTSGYTLIGSGGGFPGLYFNPYAFAVAIAIQVIMSAMTCNEDEAMLAMRRGANLCSPKIGDWCTKEVLGVCITRAQSYCCYNSKFARLVNVQGRAQLGMGWGNPQSPNCSGFNAGQLKQIDFSQIDMSELIDDIMKSYDPTYINADLSNAQSNVQASQDQWVQENCARAKEIDPTVKLPPECN